MMQGVKDIAARGQRHICKLLRRLDMAQEGGSEAISMETLVATIRALGSGGTEREQGFF
jgi:hypothetical protein